VTAEDVSPGIAVDLHVGDDDQAAGAGDRRSGVLVLHPAAGYPDDDPVRTDGVNGAECVRVDRGNVAVVGLDDHRIIADSGDPFHQPEVGTIRMFERTQLTDADPAHADADQSLPVNQRGLHRSVGHDETTGQDTAE
jgi:hypothetical protein